MCEQNASYLAKHSKLGSNIQKNLPENYTKSTKIAITAWKFLKFFGRACPRTPLEPFLFLNQLQITYAEKIRLKSNMEIIAPPPFKISRCATGFGA